MITQNETLSQKLETAVSAIRRQSDLEADIAIVLGTGLGGLAESIDVAARIPYEEIPHFPHSTVESHAGELVLGHLAGKPIIAMQGRFHLYEGYSMQEVTFPIRVMKALGVSHVLLSNAAGGMNPQYQLGDLVVVSDHINFMGDNPLIGPNDDTLGPRFPDMSEPYDRTLLALAESVALEEKIRLHKGVYIGVTGPCLETAAEYRFMRQIGADVVGMSTIPEAIVGVHAGLKMFAISCVTDMCLPDALKAADVSEIIATAQKAEPLMNRIMQRMIERISV